MSEPAYVNFNDVDLVWEQALSILEPSFDYCDGKWQPDDVHARLKASAAILLVNAEDESFDSAMIIWPTVYPRCNVLEVAFAGGRKEELKGMIPALKQWAETFKCDRIEVHGRPGWIREFKDIAEHTSSTVRMML